MPTHNVSKKRGKSKIKISDKREAVMRRMGDSYSEDFDVKITVIQELIPLGLKAVADELQEEVKKLAGEKHSHGGSASSNNARWGRQQGSVYLRDQKFPISVPRVRDVAANREVPLETYSGLQRPFDDDEGAMCRLLHGLSTHKYHESAALAAEAFGISASSLSKRFTRCSADTLKQLQERSLAGEDFVAVFLDAKRYAADGIMVGVGVTIAGKKVVLGVEQMSAERADAVTQWFDRLITRGFRFERGILFIIDWSKGIRKAIEQTFGPYALIQRCRWHKRENVVSYLNEADQVVFRRRLQESYALTTYKEALAGLKQVHRELEKINVSAANSLLEGLDETLTIHELGLSVELARSLSTTNGIESLFSQLGAYTDKVDRWHHSGQILRWTATGLMDLEPRMHRISGHQFLKVLRYKLSTLVATRTGKHPAAADRELVKAD